jgi:AraC family transcriptional regulator
MGHGWVSVVFWGKVLIVPCMDQNGRDTGYGAGEAKVRAPAERVIASGKDWSVAEYMCYAGPSDRPFEEMREGYTIAAVVEGSFTYKADSGDALLHPGAFLLGNGGKCFECGHDHSTGDRCVAFHFAPEFFAEIATTAAGTSNYRFPAAMIPVAEHLMPIIARIETMAHGVEPLRVVETASLLAKTVIASLSGHTGPHARVSTLEKRRAVDAMRYIEVHSADPLDLDTLAGIAGVSKYHFLRIFQRTIGMTPYQFVLGVRMRSAAVRLVVSSETVTAIALDSGFGDLSTFNRRFRQIFGIAPLAYRARGGIG